MRRFCRFCDWLLGFAGKRLGELDAQANVPAERVPVDWTRSEELSDFRRLYSFHDRTCRDVRGRWRPAWQAAHLGFRYPVHTEDHARLPYRVEESAGSFRFVSEAKPDTWIYLVSRQELPEAHAIEFDYLPRTVFREQLQMDFALTSLADRHRLILSDNRRIRYQRIERGFALPDRAGVPCSLELGKSSRIRLEVVGRQFALLIDGRFLTGWRDERYRPRPSRSFLVFWNGRDGRAMDFSISNFQVQVPREEAK